MSIADEKYVSLTTYRKNGDSSTTPVWIADLGDGTLGFTTPGSSLKARRLKNDSRVMLQPSDNRGKPTPGTSPIDGTAAIVEGADFEAVRAKIKAKYGWQVTMIGLIGKVARVFGKDKVSNRGIVITLAEPGDV